MKNNNQQHCPKCGTAIPEDAPGGLCPQCVLAGAAAAAVTKTSGRKSAPPSVEEIAPHFPELEIIELLGAGGMGAVYKARQPQLDRVVALKILSNDLASDPAFTERFNREAKVLARLSHPNIVGIFDFGTAGPHCYLLMEYVDGVNLRQAMHAGQFTPSESLAMVEEICSALKFAHEEGILHRDIKPENVLIDSKGRVKIADFGIAKLVGESEANDVTLTLQGSVLGSPHYMAPEQIETPGDVDQRADIYSLGVVFYELLTGELPIGRFALPSEKAAMDARIDDIVLRTLEKERQARFQSAEEVMTQVGAVAQTPASAQTVRPTVLSGDNDSARFSLLSAILTGCSVIFTIIFFWFWNTNNEQVVTASGVAESTSGKLLLGVLLMIIAAGSAICGFFMGAYALSQIRKSGGSLSGLGSSVFAVVVWPILFLGVIGTLFIPGTIGGAPVGPWVVMLFVGLPQLLAGFILVRGLCRWARGVTTKDGEQRFPGLTGTILSAIGVIILGVLLLEITIRVFPAKEDPNHPSQVLEPVYPTERAEKPNTSRVSRGPSLDEDVRWRSGKPELSLALVVKNNLQINLRMFIKDTSEGTQRHIVEDKLPRPTSDETRSVLKVGTEVYDTLQRLVITRSGPKSRQHKSLEDLRGYEFNRTLPEELVFDSTGQLTYELATFKGEEEEKTLKQLILVAEVNP